MLKKYIRQIKQGNYERVRPIFAELAETHLNITAVLDGNCPGQVYADDVTHPKTAYLISGDGYYLAGASHNRAFNAALGAALPRDTYFVLFCNPGQWEDALDAVLKDTYAIRATRHYYTLGQLKIADWRDRIPEGFSMQPVDADLLAR